MKKILLFTIILLTACSGKQQGYLKAENPLDAGREYIGACLTGDFAKAAFYMVPGESNERRLAELEKAYREKDKEGRQQYRAASINISEVADVNADTTLIRYSNSFDKQPETLQVVKQKDSWLVNLTDRNKPLQ